VQGRLRTAIAKNSEHARRAISEKQRGWKPVGAVKEKDIYRRNPEHDQATFPLFEMLPCHEIEFFWEFQEVQWSDVKIARQMVETRGRVSVLF
jgi:hypothetical protein